MFETLSEKLTSTLRKVQWSGTSVRESNQTLNNVKWHYEADVNYRVVKAFYALSRKDQLVKKSRTALLQDNSL